MTKDPGLQSLQVLSSNNFKLEGQVKQVEKLSHVKQFMLLLHFLQ